MGSLAFIDLIRLLLIFVLAYLAYIDLRTFRLPDLITLPLILIGLCFNSFSNITNHIFLFLYQLLLGNLILMYLYSLVYKLIFLFQIVG